MLEIVYPSRIAPVLRGAAGKAREEMLPVVDEHGIVEAQASRSFVHGGGKVLHPVVHLHLMDREGRVYLQKRSATKILLPGFWDTSVGGHVSYGETIREALYREAQEEIGLYDFNPIEIDSYVWESPTERELVHVFAVIGAFKPVPDLDEVEEGRFWTDKEIGASVGKGLLTPNFEVEYSRIAASLQALL